MQTVQVAQSEMYQEPLLAGERPSLREERKALEGLPLESKRVHPDPGLCPEMVHLDPLAHLEMVGWARLLE